MRQDRKGVEKRVYTSRYGRYREEGVMRHGVYKQVWKVQAGRTTPASIKS